ncbi:GDSL-type esterase/lipase family protein [Pedobacter sp. JY14-1]|uniref:GDSL-type esterase/lipase family protein n=1 Tax=Pedobacter sp. JY14-1 TaxID=3034151 RepID=UPI0023E0FF31|nr:GDSL-type esterase/lipase family protein [Pedobacter sp. JY14-1]
MKHNLLFRIFFVALVSLSAPAFAQTKPFWNEIQQFRKKDSVAMPAPGGIVFTGSSSIRMWGDLETVYKDYNVINRGFGGSVIPQANEYLEDLVLKYKPRQVVIYSGENDIASGISAEQTSENFKILFSNIRNHLPKTAIAYVSMKLSPSREKFSSEVLKANGLIRDYLSKQKNAAYIDITSKMLDSNGKMRPELFREDMLHMRPAGYEIWVKAITPYLKKK